jgi:hypothetical protein
MSLLWKKASNKAMNYKDRQCAEVNRQKIEGESPLSGKA